MAHDISIRSNGFAEMAYVGDTPWHSLGQVVSAGASIAEWQKAAGLDWHAARTNVAYMVDGALREMTSRTVLYRSDTGAPLSVVSPEYQVVQPSECLEFFRDICSDSGWYIHTAGALRGGRKVWAMASNRQAGAVRGDDLVHSNILIATSLDGTLQTTVQPTSVRVVCANTLGFALDGEGKDRAIKVSHRTRFDAAEVRAQLGLIPAAFESFMQSARRMAETPISQEEARDVLREIWSPREVAAKGGAVQPKAPRQACRRNPSRICLADRLRRKTRTNRPTPNCRNC